MRMSLLFALVFATAGSALATGCSTTVPATITRPPAAALDDEPAVFLVAVRQRDAVKRSLVRAGIRVVESGVAPYNLKVKIGSSRGNQACGTKNNVVYSLSARGRTLLGMKGRGWTGDCPENILDEMSALLARQFTRGRSAR